MPIFPRSEWIRIFLSKSKVPVQPSFAEELLEKADRVEMVSHVFSLLFACTHPQTEKKYFIMMQPSTRNAWSVWSMCE